MREVLAFFSLIILQIQRDCIGNQAIHGELRICQSADYVQPSTKQHGLSGPALRRHATPKLPPRIGDAGRPTLRVKADVGSMPDDQALACL